jgi:hypothetical protein
MKQLLSFPLVGNLSFINTVERNKKMDSEQVGMTRFS